MGQEPNPNPRENPEHANLNPNASHNPLKFLLCRRGMGQEPNPNPKSSGSERRGKAVSIC